MYMNKEGRDNHTGAYFVNSTLWLNYPERFSPPVKAFFIKTFCSPSCNVSVDLELRKAKLTLSHLHERIEVSTWGACRIWCVLKGCME